MRSEGHIFAHFLPTSGLITAQFARRNPYEKIPDQAIMGQPLSATISSSLSQYSFSELPLSTVFSGVPPDNRHVVTDGWCPTGYRIRTDRWAYIAWMGFNWGVGSDPRGEASVPVFTDVSALELYDHEGDTGNLK